MSRAALSLILMVAGALLATPAQAQLVNGSFESSGIGPETFLGWVEFGDVSSSTDLATDGTKTARIGAPQNGGYDVSAIHQGIPITPGQFVHVTLNSGFVTATPIVGETRSLVNVEWRDSGGGLISYNSLASSMSCDAPDSIHSFERIIGPAPTGAVEARLLLGIINTPNNQPGVVHFDEVKMVIIAPPTKLDIQWNDFGSRTIEWSGFT